MKTLKTACTLTMLGALAASAGQASANVLATDSYNTGPDGYNAGAHLTGQDPANAPGFGPWTSGTANLQVEAGGILDGDTNSGQGKFVPASSSSYRAAFHTLDPIAVAPSNNTFYTSKLINAGTSGGAVGQYAFVGFGSFVAQDTIEGNANNLLGAFVGFVQQSDNTLDLVLRSRTGAGAGEITETLLLEDAAGITYNIVTAIEYNNPGDQVRVWVNPTDFSNGETGLTATASSSAAVSGFQLSALSDMDRFTVATTFSNRSFFWDETILATEVADIPEPGSLALLGLGGLMLARRRR